MRALAEQCCGTNWLQESRCARLHSPRQWKARPGKSSGKCNGKSDSALPNGDARPAPCEERAEGPRGCLRASRSWVVRALQIRRTLNDKLVVEREANNGTRGQRGCFLEGKP